MVWLLLSWIAVSVVVAVGFGAMSHHAEAAGDPLAASEGRVPSETVQYPVDDTNAHEDRAAA